MRRSRCGRAACTSVPTLRAEGARRQALLGGHAGRSAGGLGGRGGVSRFRPWFESRPVLRTSALTGRAWAHCDHPRVHVVGTARGLGVAPKAGGPAATERQVGGTAILGRPVLFWTASSGPQLTAAPGCEGSAPPRCEPEEGRQALSRLDLSAGPRSSLGSVPQFTVWPTRRSHSQDTNLARCYSRHGTAAGLRQPRLSLEQKESSVRDPKEPSASF